MGANGNKLNNQQLLVSVVIPTYNFGHLLPYTLDSLLAQSYQNWECLVIDDGSVDNTSEVLSEYIKKDSRVTYIRQQNQGPGAARNRGIKECRGEVIQFLDADDLLEPEKIKYQVEVMNNEPEIDIVYGSTLHFISKESTPHLVEDLKEDTMYRPKVSGKGRAVVQEFLKTTFFPSSSIIRRSLVMELNMLDIELIQAEDWDLYLRAATKEAVFRYIESPPGTRALIRSHGHNNTINFFRLQYYVIKMRQKFARTSNDIELNALNQQLIAKNSEDLIYQIQLDLKEGKRKQAIVRSFKVYSLTHKLRYLVYALLCPLLTASAYIAITSAEKSRTF